MVLPLKHAMKLCRRELQNHHIADKLNAGKEITQTACNIVEAVVNDKISRPVIDAEPDLTLVAKLIEDRGLNAENNDPRRFIFM